MLSLLQFILPGKRATTTTATTDGNVAVAADGAASPPDKTLGTEEQKPFKLNYENNPMVFDAWSNFTVNDLVLTDGSPGSDAAVARALSWCNMEGGEPLVLMTFAQVKPDPFDLPVDFNMEVTGEGDLSGMLSHGVENSLAIRSAEQVLTNSLEKCQDHFVMGILLETELSPINSAVDFVDKHHAKSVFIGSHKPHHTRESLLSKLWHGPSFANKLMSTVTADVVVSRSPSTLKLHHSANSSSDDASEHGTYTDDTQEMEGNLTAVSTPVKTHEGALDFMNWFSSLD
jgi:nucleotide-binding universal stress UspA family protein